MKKIRRKHGLVRRPRKRRVGRRRSQPQCYRRQWCDEPRDLKLPTYTSIDEAPRDLVERARDKYKWIARFVGMGCPRGRLREFMEQYAEATNVPRSDVPSYTTAVGWVHRFRAFGLVGLVDSVRADAGSSRTISKEVANLMEIAVIGGGMRMATAILAFITRQLRLTDMPPKYHTLWRAIRNFKRHNAHLVALAQKGKIWFRNIYRLALCGDNFPGGFRLSVDSTVADIWVRIRDVNADCGWRAVRVALTVVEDLGSRTLVTFNLSLSALDSGILCGVLRRALIRDHNYPGLASVPSPAEMVVDKGAEHQGRFIKLLNVHGITVIPTEPHDAESRGRIERVIGTLQREVFAGEVGYSPTHNVFNPYATSESDTKRSMSSLKYEPYRDEVSVMMLNTLDELEHKILAWATLYCVRPHDGLPAHSPELRRLADAAAQLDAAQRGDEQEAA